MIIRHFYSFAQSIRNEFGLTDSSFATGALRVTRIILFFKSISCFIFWRKRRWNDEMRSWGSMVSHFDFTVLDSFFSWLQTRLIIGRENAEKHVLHFRVFHTRKTPLCKFFFFAKTHLPPPATKITFLQTTQKEKKTWTMIFKMKKGLHMCCFYPSISSVLKSEGQNPAQRKGLQESQIPCL